MSPEYDNFHPHNTIGAMTYGVDIAAKQWTPFSNRIFEEVIANLEGRHAAALYLWLYDRVYHRPTRSTALTVAQISRWREIDERIVNKCLLELREKKLIRLRQTGVKRSRTIRDVWEVPLANLDLREGNWTPVPRLLIREYIRSYPNSVLLPLLLYYQNLRQMNFCWPGVPTLSRRLNWSATRVRDALRHMFDAQNWNDQHPDLPRPLNLSVVNQNGQPRRRFTVRAVFFERKGKRMVMRVSPTFRKAFEML